ncbi:hypothetical protein [Kutzneria kofuensis]|uniref:Uncharacterized protein n=1 Tax=Kutzneria kofuensis TaxID=103725 RepID=A0A7W9KJM6_9PSEU|nr:hypothetical protein [Kutzneria kofuensis]MBB5893833.1 hypothetical protein [Kutzneria kofuensis]
MSCALDACSPARPLPVALWLTVPVLFTATVLGLVGGASLALGVGDGMEPLSAPVFGAAAGVTAALHSGVAWGRRERLRRIARGYPVLVLVTGIALSWASLPSLVGVAIGVPAAIATVAVCVWERSDYQLSSDHGA